MGCHHEVVAGPARGDLTSGQRQCHGRVLGVFCSPGVVQEVIGSAEARLFFPGDPCLLLRF